MAAESANAGDWGWGVAAAATENSGTKRDADCRFFGCNHCRRINERSRPPKRSGSRSQHFLLLAQRRQVLTHAIPFGWGLL